MITFKQARQAVAQQYGRGTHRLGLEDAQDYLVKLAPTTDPQVDGQIVLVDRETGEVHQELYILVMDRIDEMSSVVDSK